MLELVPLLTVHVRVDPDIEVGEIAGVGYRRLIPIRGGTFEGDRLRGTILDNGADWNTVRSDDTMHFWARYTLLTDDGVYIGVINEGWQPNVSQAMPYLDRLEDAGDLWRPRTNPRFEAPVGAYEWLNSGTFVAGSRQILEPGLVELDFYEVR